MRRAFLDTLEGEGPAAPTEEELADELLQQEIEELLGEADGGQDDVAEPVGAAARLIQNRYRPIYEGANITVIQSAYVMLSLKRKGRIRDGAFDMCIRVIHDVMLPAGNLFPPSLYMMRRVIGCRTLEDVSIHVCVNDCATFGKVRWQSARPGAPVG